MLILTGDIVDHLIDPGPGLEEQLDQKALRETVLSMLRVLPWIHRRVIQLSFGIDEPYSYTLEEIGRILKTGRERVACLRANALRRLQHHSDCLLPFVEDFER